MTKKSTFSEDLEFSEFSSSRQVLYAMPIKLGTMKSAHFRIIENKDRFQFLVDKITKRCCK